MGQRGLPEFPDMMRESAPRLPDWPWVPDAARLVSSFSLLFGGSLSAESPPVRSMTGDGADVVGVGSWSERASLDSHPLEVLELAQGWPVA